MLFALVLSTVLAAEPELSPAPPPAVAPPVEPAEDPAVVETVSQERLQRIAATLGGGAAGIALPMLAGFAGQLTQGPCPSPSFGGCTTDGPIAVAASFMPVTYALGIAVPHHLRGGKAGFGFGLAGAAAGYLATTSLLGLVSLSGSKDWMKSIPVPGGALIAAFSLIGGVAAMELRHDALTSGAKPWALGRGIAAGAAFWLPAALVELAIVFGLDGLQRSGGASQWVPVLYVLATVANFSLSSLGAWGAHRALDGKGSYWTALVGGIVSSAVAMGFFAIHVHGPPANGITGRNFSPSHMVIPIVVFTALIAAAGPSVGLEWSSARAPDVDESFVPGLDDLQVNLNGGFSPGGGFSFGLSGSF